MKAAMKLKVLLWKQMQLWGAFLREWWCVLWTMLVTAVIIVVSHNRPVGVGPCRVFNDRRVPRPRCHREAEGIMKAQPLGYNSARNAVKAGRAAFFTGPDADLPANRSALLAGDDMTPQFGYVGANYAENASWWNQKVRMSDPDVGALGPCRRPQASGYVIVPVLQSRSSAVVICLGASRRWPAWSESR